MQKKIDIEGNVQKVIESLYNNQDGSLIQENIYLKLAKFATNILGKAKKMFNSTMTLAMVFTILWLDETMTYFCAYFKSPEDSLNQAQKNKVEHILRKLNLQPGQTLLDIGCGWENLFLVQQKLMVLKLWE